MSRNQKWALLFLVVALIAAILKLSGIYGYPTRWLDFTFIGGYIAMLAFLAFEPNEDEDTVS